MKNDFYYFMGKLFQKGQVDFNVSIYLSFANKTFPTAFDSHGHQHFEFWT